MSEEVQKHYDHRARHHTQTRQERAQGVCAPLKRYHNDVKRRLLELFVKGPEMLDLACGRGGDIHKWDALHPTLQRVTACDLSAEGVEEARRRCTPGKGPDKIFVHHNLILETFKCDRPVDTISCMFALHYFFGTRDVLRRFLETVSMNLAPGGYFVGVVPDGAKIHAASSNDIMHIRKTYDEPQVFGSAYSFSIEDTVTYGGAFEYLVFEDVLVSHAAQYDLMPCDIGTLDGLLKVPKKPFGVFHAFDPPESLPETMAAVSKVFAAFAFRKAF